ncbi:hypothetical protein [Actinomadura macra]|uniref:hypothetical protein n=1 Tax=Actinomadura macra TaxID=46164 RepID=UPI000B274E53|nr:hypothetical protein [Actinomadura macra]
MRTRRGKIVEKGNVLARLRASDDGPDPRFRAALRERLIVAADDHGEDHHCAHDHPGPACSPAVSHPDRARASATSLRDMPR